MKKFIIFISCTIVLACKSSKKIDVINSKEEEFVLAYKKCVLYSCINEATENKFNLFIKENNDLGLAVEVAIMQHAEVAIAIEKGKVLAKEVNPIDYSDYQGKKPIFSSCISFAFSKDIDSIARKTYNEKEKK